jgi:pilus assembly protein CpaF
MCPARGQAARSGRERRITLAELIRASLRMRPDRIIVGEVRGREAFDMLQAMNTGHPVSLCTGHATPARTWSTAVLDGPDGRPDAMGRDPFPSRVSA